MKSRSEYTTDKKIALSRENPLEKRQDDLFYDPVNQAYILKSVKEIREGKGTPHELIKDTDERETGSVGA